MKATLFGFLLLSTLVSLSKADTESYDDYAVSPDDNIYELYYEPMYSLEDDQGRWWCSPFYMVNRLFPGHGFFNCQGEGDLHDVSLIFLKINDHLRKISKLYKKESAIIL